MFSRLLRHQTWKCSGPILILALHKFVTHLDTYPLSYSLGPTRGIVSVAFKLFCSFYQVIWLSSHNPYLYLFGTLEPGYLLRTDTKFSYPL